MLVKLSAEGLCECATTGACEVLITVFICGEYNTLSDLYREHLVVSSKMFGEAAPPEVLPTVSLEFAPALKVNELGIVVPAGEGSTDGAIGDGDCELPLFIAAFFWIQISVTAAYV